jgi:hypothetical protein
LELLGGVLGWTWLIGLAAGTFWALGWLFSDFSGWTALALLLGAQFAKGGMRIANRAGQGTIQDGLRRGLLSSDSSGRVTRSAGPDPTDADALQQQVSDKLAWAQNLAGKYAHLLDSSGRPEAYYIPEGTLPGGVEDIKEALLILAATGTVTDSLSASDVETYRSCYMTLVRVVPDGPAVAHNDVIRAIADAGGPDRLSPSQLRESLSRFATSFRDVQDQKDPRRDGATLLMEFDTRLAAMVAYFKANAP